MTLVASAWTSGASVDAFLSLPRRAAWRRGSPESWRAAEPTPAATRQAQGARLPRPWKMDLIGR
jgi:hypothetical protein